MKVDDRNILFQRYNLKHNRLWSQGLTLFVTIVTIISAFAISMFALSRDPINKIIIFKEYLVLSVIIILFSIAFTITLINLWTNRKLLISMLPKN